MRIKDTAAATALTCAVTWLVAPGCETPPPSVQEEEQVGISMDEINLASCDAYMDPTKPHPYSCAKKKPGKRVCNRLKMPDGAGWDRCKWPDPKWGGAKSNCAKDNGIKCPAPPAGGCLKAIFGRLDDSKPYYGCPGYIVINLPDAEWSQDINDLYEDCILYGQIPGLCDPPMMFVSGTTWDPTKPWQGIPDYDPDIPPNLTPIPPGHTKSGQITAREICRAMKCHQCQMVGRNPRGYVPTKCKNFKPLPKAVPGKIKKKPGAAKTAALMSDPTLTCAVTEYECVPCAPEGDGGAGGFDGTGGFGGFDGTGGFGGFDGTGGFGGVAGPAVAENDLSWLAAQEAVALQGGGEPTGGAGAAGGAGGAGGDSGGSGGAGGAENAPAPDIDFTEESVCGACDAAVPIDPEDGFCSAGEEGEDCGCSDDWQAEVDAYFAEEALAPEASCDETE